MLLGLALWTTLREMRDHDPELLSTDLDDLLHRAQQQRQVLETERIAAAKRSLTSDRGSPSGRRLGR